MSPEREGAAVAYALLIMRDGPDFPVDWPEQNASLLERYGESGLRAIKQRAWKHVRANREAAAPPVKEPPTTE